MNNISHMGVQQCFSVLGNELRIKIIEALKEKPMGVNDLAEKVNADRTNVSHSLAMLKECGFVHAEKNGRERVYSLSSCIVSDMKVTGNIFELMQYHMEHHCKSRCGK